MSDTDSWWLYCWQQRHTATEPDAEAECVCAHLLNRSAAQDD